MSFIGRGEDRVKDVLSRLFPEALIQGQVNIKSLIPKEEYDSLDPEFQKHNFDINVNYDTRTIIIEVNYKHKVKASRKWRIFTKLILENDCEAVAINDYDCESLFDTKEERPIRWNDFIDVINALKTAGVQP